MSGDLSKSQADELEDAIDQLTSNQFVMGDHHFTLQVQGEAFEAIQEADSLSRLRELNNNLALARTILADTGMTVAREDLGERGGILGATPR